MPGLRVYQLAKELKVQSALILELLDRLGKEVHSDLSSLDISTAALVREKLTAAVEHEKRRLMEQRRRARHPAGHLREQVVELVIPRNQLHVRLRMNSRVG